MQLEDVKIEGLVRGYQTKLEMERVGNLLIPRDTGIIVPGSEKEWRKNTVQNALLYYLAYKIGTYTTDRALDDLFTGDGTVGSVGAAQDGKDGIGHRANGTLNYLFRTTKNVGGDLTLDYIEFYGSITGPATLTGSAVIGSVYVNSTTTFTKEFGVDAAINETLAANRVYHHYYKFTLS